MFTWMQGSMSWVNCWLFLMWQTVNGSDKLWFNGKSIYVHFANTYLVWVKWKWMRKKMQQMKLYAIAMLLTHQHKHDIRTIFFEQMHICVFCCFTFVCCPFFLLFPFPAYTMKNCTVDFISNRRCVITHYYITYIYFGTEVAPRI